MKRPWMPLYVGDYLANTGHLTTIQHGAYLLLIMHYWVHEHLPTDERQLASIARMAKIDWDSNCYAIASLFTKDWKHHRIEKELQKAKNLNEARSLAGLKGAMKRHGWAKANGVAKS